MLTMPPFRPIRTMNQSPSERYCCGERLDTRSIESGTVLGTAPVATSIDGGGITVLFRYGVVILFGASRDAADRLLGLVQPFVTELLPVPEQEEAWLITRQDTDQFVDTAGNIVLPDRTIERLQLVADVLAKNLMLSHYETHIASIFDRIEPLAATLRKQGRTGARSRELLRHIGNVLAMQHKMVGRVETGRSRNCSGSIPNLNASTCGSPMNTNCGIAIGRLTASST